MNHLRKLIVALDVDTLSEMEYIVEATKNEVMTYKIGHQLFTAEGPITIQYLKKLNKSVFLDLKLHEIPNSVAAAVRSAGRQGVDMVTVHALGGSKMMQAAVETALEFPNMKVLALTVVTGLNDQDLIEIGIQTSSEEQVVKLAQLAENNGCHGVIASPLETKRLREVLREKMLIMTPGIRPTGTLNHDHSRVGSPVHSIKSGASHIIVGRPIVKSDNPTETVRQILAELSK